MSRFPDHPDYEMAYEVAVEMRDTLDRQARADPSNRDLVAALAGAQMVVDALALEGGRLAAAPVIDEGLE